MRPDELIDIDLWGRASWMASGFASQGGKAPSLLLVFKNGGAAKKLFQDLRRRVGVRDVAGLIRVAVIVDDRKTPPLEYFVHIGPSDELIRQAMMSGEVNASASFPVVTRINEMSFSPATAKAIALFQQHLQSAQYYCLTPALVRPEGVTELDALGIELSTIIFRRVSDIRDRNDIDAIAKCAPVNPSSN